MTQNSVQTLQSLSTQVNDYNSQHSIISAILSKIHTATLAKVIKVTNSGGISPVGMVDLQPLVNQVSGSGVAVSQGVVHNVPYFRLQGGANAIIIDPQAGDIGVAIFAERDISSVVTNKAQSNPGSARQYDGTDAMYLGSFLGSAPTQYIQFNSSGVTIYSPGSININAGGAVEITAPGGLTVTGNTQITGNFAFSGTGQNAGVDIGSTHAHQVVGVQPGSATIETTPPNE